MYTHRLAHACISRLIYAADKHPAGEGDVEAEVDQHVPKLAAHADRPEVTETNQSLKARTNVLCIVVVYFYSVNHCNKILFYITNKTERLKRYR